MITSIMIYNVLVGYHCAVSGKGFLYHCNNGACQPLSWAQDGFDDCGDESDERK